MGLRNTSDSYGLAARLLHWLTAVAILAALPAGFAANSQPVDTALDIERVIALFSLHKSLGIIALAIGLIRILWTLGQVTPRPAAPERRAEELLARTVHWTLYGGLLAVPLTGWLTHAVSPPLAPLWLPVDPHLAESERAAALFGAMHRAATKVLAAAILLHVAGALKHALWNRDGLVLRMITGRAVPSAAPVASKLPWAVAAALWAGSAGLGALMAPPMAELEAPRGLSEWSVTGGEIHLVAGEPHPATVATAEAWSARLDLGADAGGELAGSVEITIVTAAVTPGEPGADIQAWLDPSEPFITIVGAISGPPGAADVDATLTIGAVTLPAPMMLRIEAGTARLEGRVGLLPAASSPAALAIRLAATAPAEP